jgi:quercetin dioxygenase-like cupin family protein
MQVTKIVKNEEREVVDLSGPQIEPLTSREEQSYFVLKGTLPPDVNVPLHSHGDPESFYVLSGEGQVLAQTEGRLEWKTVGRGDFVHISPGTKHAWRNRSMDAFEVVMTVTPKLGRFLLEFGEIATAECGAQLVRKLRDLDERYGYWSGSPEENAAVGIESI